MSDPKKRITDAKAELAKAEVNYTRALTLKETAQRAVDLASKRVEDARGNLEKAKKEAGNG